MNLEISESARANKTCLNYEATKRPDVALLRMCRVIVLK